MANAKQRREDPKPYEFSAEDRLYWSDKYWRLPVRLVESKGEPGLWRALWRPQGGERGGGAITSVLPVLATHAWPNRPDPAGGEVDPEWTREARLSRRRLARVAGVAPDTATVAIRQLENLDLLRRPKPTPRDRFEPGTTRYRLSRKLYAHGGEPFVRFRAALLYNGTWSLLPSNAARHLYVVLAALDPIRDEEAYVRSLDESHPAGDDIWIEKLYNEHIELADNLSYLPDDERAINRLYFLHDRRAKAARSQAELERFSGMTKSTVQDALRILTTPMFGGYPVPKDRVPKDWAPGLYEYPPTPLVATTPPELVVPRAPRWYAPHSEAPKWGVDLEVLKDPKRVRALQLATWSHLDARLEAAAKRRRNAPAKPASNRRKQMPVDDPFDYPF